MLKERTIRFLAAGTLWLAVSIWLSGAALAEKFTPVSLKQKELLQVKVYRLTIDPASKQPVVFLTDSTEEHALPIWIGLFEANAIHSEMQGIKHSRPQTHDLLEKIIQKTNGKIHRIIIPYVKGNIYYATIVMEREGSLIEIDARPSDSIVMALKFKVPIFVSKTLFKDMAVSIVEDKEIEEQYGLTLQELTPSLAQSFSFESTHGVLVSEVQKGSRAERDGIKRGDIFVKVGGHNIENMMSLKSALEKSETAVEARIFRRAQFLSLTLHPK